MSSPGTFRFGQVNSTPSAPPSGYDLIYVKTDDVLYIQDSSGIETPIGTASGITQLTGDVSATGPGVVPATVNFVGGVSASNIALGVNAANAATSTDTPSTIILRDSSGNFSAGIITASLNGNSATATTSVSFSGSLSGDVTGTQSSTVVSMVDGFTATQVGTSITTTQNATSSNIASTLVQRNASGNFSAGIITASLSGNATSSTTSVNFTGILMGDVTGTQSVTVVSLVGGQTASAVASATVQVQNATSSNISSTIVERDASGNFSATSITSSLIGNVNGNVSGSSSSFTGSLSGDVTGTQSATSIVSTVVTGKVLTGYVVGSNTPILATDTILVAFEKTQGQLNATSGSAITALTGDATATGPGSVILTLATVNTNTGSFGSSTSIPSFTVNSKGLITAASGNAVVAPAGTLTGSTLASNVLSSSLTSVGIITSGTWNGTTLAIANGGTGQTTAAAAFIALSPLTNAGDIIYENSVPAPTNLPIGTTGQLLTVVGGLPAWQTLPSASLPTITLTGNVTGSGSGGTIPTTIASNVVTNTMLAQMSTMTLKGNNTGSTSDALDLTVSQVNTMLETVTTIGTIDTNANSNGLFISGNTLSTQSASISNPGMINNTTQSFSGNKTFTGTVAILLSNTDALAINSTSFVFDSVNNVMGIGIQPSTSVMIDGVNTTGASKLIQMTGYGVGSTTGYRGRFARGTSGTPTAVQSGDVLNALSGRGYGASQFATASTGVINVVAGETFTNTSNLTYLQFSTTPTGSVTSAEAMRVATTGITLGPQSASTALHQVNGGIQRTTRTVTASTLTVDTTTTDDIIFTDSTSNAIAITLPAATNGRVLVIQDKTGQAATNHITVIPPGAVTINGVNASVLLGVNYGGWVFMSDGTNWTYYRIPQLPTVSAIGSTTIDWSTVGIAGGLFTKTLSANTTFTFSNATPGQTIVIRLTNTASNYTVTWPTIKWPVQTTPVMTTGAFSDVYTIIYDGTNFFGSYVQNF